MIFENTISVMAPRNIKALPYDCYPAIDSNMVTILTEESLHTSFCGAVSIGSFQWPARGLVTLHSNYPPKKFMQLFIKNMVCDRCIMVVGETLKNSGLHPASVVLGEAEIEEPELNKNQLLQLNTALKNAGFELLEGRRSRMVEMVKTAIIELVHHSGDTDNLKYSEYLAKHTGTEYSQLSKNFTEETGSTIEQYIIRQKIERVKELLSYGEKNLSEISWEMGYSSVAALSNQFKKVIGLSPSEWKNSSHSQREPLHEIGKSKPA